MLTHVAYYDVKYIMGEWWSTFATCQQKAHADKVEAMLLAEGKTTRIDEVHNGTVLGEPKTPEAK